jgi:hypothetical protein
MLQPLHVARVGRCQRPYIKARTAQLRIHGHLIFRHPEPKDNKMIRFAKKTDTPATAAKSVETDEKTAPAPDAKAKATVAKKRGASSKASTETDDDKLL